MVNGSALLPLAALGLGLYGALRCIGGDLDLGFASLWASAFLFRWQPDLRRVENEHTPVRAAWPPLLLVAAALVFFRFYRLVPPGMWGDDAVNALLAFDVLDGKIDSPFELVVHAHSHFHALTNYAIAASFASFGADLASFRIPGAVAGCLAGLFFYGTTRRLFGTTTALFAGLLFASSPMEIAHSKNLLQVVLGLMFQCAGIYGLLRGLQERSTRWSATGGVALAATLYTYHAAKLAPLAALPLLVGALREGRPSRRTLLAATLGFGAGLLPFAGSFWNQPEALTGRAQAVSILTEMRDAGSAWPLLVSAAKTLAIFHVEQGPTRYHWFGPGNDPALTPIAAALVLPGLIASTAGWRERRHVLLLWWFVVGLAPALLSTEAPRGYRALLATPPVFVWVAIPLAALWNSPRSPLRVAAVALALTSLLFDFNYYFHRGYSHEKSRWMVGARIVDMADMVRAHGSGWVGYVMSPTFTSRHETLRMLARMWDLELHDAPSLSYALQRAPLPEAGAVFLTAPGSHEALEFLEERLPAGERIARYAPPEAMWWWGGSWPYETSEPRSEPVAAALSVRRQTLERYRSSADRLPIAVTCRSVRGVRRWRELAPFYDFFPDLLERPATCRWSGRIRVPAPGPAHLRVTADQPVEVRVDRAPYSPAAPIRAGSHRISISMTRPAQRVRLKVYWRVADQHEMLVPPSAWRDPAGG